MSKMQASRSKLIRTSHGSPSYYVAIGASAGGLEALQELFGNLDPNIGATYIVVQHLSPDYKSMMPGLLSKHVDMPIESVTNGLEMKADHIYLMPARKSMEIHDGILTLIDHAPSTHVHLPIDTFFSSLARDKQHRAIGVVLSGTGSDGTRGIKTLKEQNGMVIVQEPSTAKFDGMPISAFNTGLADLVLAPKDIGTKLASYMRHPVVSHEDSPLVASLNENDSPLSDIFELLKKHSNINFTTYKTSTVARRIERRMGINQITSLDSYYRLLLESPREAHVLSRELLIGVTRFFRDSDAFSHLGTHIIPQVVRNNLSSSDCIRIWVAGCSTGEEAYSIAMLILDEMGRQEANCQLKIFATDVDEDAIAFASAGIYSSDIDKDISTERIANYFVKNGDFYTVTQDLRRAVIFSTHNMQDDPPFSSIDLVSCRNVLIYFQQAAQKKVLSSLYFALRDKSYLFLGSSESLGDLQGYFDVAHERFRLFKKVGNLRVPLNSSPGTRASYPQARTSMMNNYSVNSRAAVQNQSRRMEDCVLERLVTEYAPDCIIINDNFDAVHIYGDVSLYTKRLSPGRVSNNIKDMVKEDLSVAVSTAIHRCEKSEADVFYKDVVVRVSDDEQISIDLSVFFIKESDHSSAPRYFVVQFIRHTDEQGKPNTPTKITFDVNAQSQQRINDLEQELVKKQEHLQVTVEELETTNEELQSANEELMSANEELQSTNEELQSVNEELYTVNSEYQQKIVELTEANDDLDHVFNTTDIGIIFLDEQLLIRKYTLWCTRYINMRMSDIGRPFNHISHSFRYDEFADDIESVSKGSASIDKEIMTLQGHILHLRILPYHKKSKSAQTGVLITINNISRFRFMEHALQKTQEQLRNVFLDSVDRLNKRPIRQQEVKVLAVDDDIVDLKRIEKFLAANDGRQYEVTLCADLTEAIEKASNEKFDVHIVDFLMGVATAKDFVAALRKNSVYTPNIILSAYSEEGIDVDFVENEILDFLNKDDLSGPLLVRSIDYVLERFALQQVLAHLDGGVDE